MNEQKIAPDSVNNGTNIGAGGSQSNAKIEDRAGLYIAIVALILAALSLGIQISQQATIDAKITAAIAGPQAEMHQASTNAMLAKERMDRAVAQLEAKGLLKPETH